VIEGDGADSHQEDGIDVEFVSAQDGEVGHVIEFAEEEQIGELEELFAVEGAVGLVITVGVLGEGELQVVEGDERTRHEGSTSATQ
jgi:hypothetical protein